MGSNNALLGVQRRPGLCRRGTTLGRTVVAHVQNAVQSSEPKQVHEVFRNGKQHELASVALKLMMEQGKRSQPGSIYSLNIGKIYLNHRFVPALDHTPQRVASRSKHEPATAGQMRRSNECLGNYLKHVSMMPEKVLRMMKNRIIEDVTNLLPT